VIKILIADDMDDTRELIKQLLTLNHNHFQVVGEASNGEEAFKLAGQLHPDIVLMDINMPVMNGLEATEAITIAHPNIDVIIMSVQAETAYLKTAMLSGAKGYLIKPIDESEMIDMIQKTFEKKRVVIQVPEGEKKSAKVISFYAFKGGVGKSLLALNTSILLAEKQKKKVLLIDLDLHFGDIALMVDKHLEKNILDYVDDGSDAEQLDQYLYHYVPNLDILFAPLSPEGAEYISKSTIEGVIQASITNYDFIVLDTGVNFEEHTLYALDQSNEIYMVTSMEMTGIKNSKLGLKVMDSLNYEEDKVKIVLNRVEEKFGVRKVDVEKLFDKPLNVALPESKKEALMSINQGRALSLNKSGKQSKLYKAMVKWVKEIVRD